MLRQGMQKMLAATTLLVAAGAEAQTYTFDPPNPQVGEAFTVNATWPYSGNFVQSQGILEAGAADGAYITVWFVQDGANFSPNPPTITASQIIPGDFFGAAGVYRVTIYWVADPASYTSFVPSQTFSFVVGGASPGPFEIGPGITGNWYDPSESGHGFSLEVLPGGVLLAEWFVYAPQGGRDWIIGTGTILGDTAIVNAYQTGGPGGRFPPAFDPSQVQNEPWGTITFTFTDCNHGTASWANTAAGYPAGSVPITRLTMPEGYACH